MPPESLLAQWREVNQRANELERKLFEASLMHTRGNGPGPSPEQWEEAQAARRQASDLFKRAMKAFEEAASAARLGLQGQRPDASGSQSGSSAAGR